MPCRDSRDDDPSYLHDQIHQQRLAIDKLTRMLCGCCKLLDDEGSNIEKRKRWPQGLVTWWKKHKKLDAKRLKDEEAAEKARAEREARDREQRIADARAVLRREGALED